LGHACKTMRRWLDAGLPVGRVSVNVSSHGLEGADFLEAVRAALESARLTATRPELELTETAMIRAGDANTTKLATLRGEGVSIAVDDFGTGYSSLSYLHRLPITTLKIDRSFVKDVTSNEKDAAITEAMVRLSQRLGYETVAEG